MRTFVMCGVLALMATGLPGRLGAVQKDTGPAEGRERAERNFERICQPCHGPKGDAPMPTMSLVDGEWLHGSSTKEIAKTIAEGVPGTAMLPNKDKLTPEEILELARLVRSFDPTLKPEKAPSPK